MTPLLTVNLLRALFVTFTTCVGLAMGEDVFQSAIGGIAAGAVFGLAIVLIDRLLKGITLRVFSSATFGLLVGFIFAQLLLSSRLLIVLSAQAQWIAGLVVYSAFSYLGMMLAIRSNRDEFSLIIPYVRFRRATVQDAPLLVDSNIIIDGRISAICSSGFLSGSLVVPRFVLEELQRLADSGDALKRERGRRALERLQQMQLDPNLSVTIYDTDALADLPVDARLAQLAKTLDARLLTNDGNLCALARLQGISVLNLNDLARAVRQALSTGDELELLLSKEGREHHQAVGYLGDGTMIVVNHARQRIGHSVAVTISGTLQTSAGRLFFAELQSTARAAA